VRLRRPEAGRGGGYMQFYAVETGEGGEPPSHLSVLKLAVLALPVSPTSHLRCLNSAPSERRSPNGDNPMVHCPG